MNIQKNKTVIPKTKTRQHSPRTVTETKYSVPPLVINSPADLIKLVPTRSKSKKSERSLQSGLRSFIILTVTLAIPAKIHLTKQTRKQTAR